MRKSRPSTRRSEPKRRTGNTKTKRGIETEAEIGTTNIVVGETDHVQGPTTTMIGTGRSADTESTTAMRRTTEAATAGAQDHDQGHALHTANLTVTASADVRAHHAEEKIAKTATATESANAHHQDAHTTSLGALQKRSDRTGRANHLPQSSRSQKKAQPNASQKCKQLHRPLKRSVLSVYACKASRTQRRKRNSRRSRTRVEDVDSSIMFEARLLIWIWVKRLRVVGRIIVLSLMFEDMI
jgi:hypothetical protein